ncbi:hypothetical protein CIB48_g4510 [Xylaria polymorpha]|nr:hypothetical protein CIB48_g4510 [Xylaria polymorpha]
MEISQIQEIVDAVDKIIKFARSGLSNPTDVDEHSVVDRLVDRLEDYYIEAQGFLHEAKAFEEEITKQEGGDSDDDCLSVILELSDEDST